MLGVRAVGLGPLQGLIAAIDSHLRRRRLERKECWRTEWKIGPIIGPDFRSLRHVSALHAHFFTSVPTTSVIAGTD